MSPSAPISSAPFASDDDREVVLAECVDDYVAAARRMTARDLRAFQHPPYASVAFGSAGIAYALWRHDAADPAAGRWLDAAARFDGPDGWLTPAYPSTLTERAPSVATGPLGIVWVRLLLAVDAGRKRSVEYWANALANGSGAGDGPAEMLLGEAGRLLALLVASGRANERLGAVPATVERSITTLADRLHADLIKTPESARHVGEAETGFARGALGLHHAVLSARRLAGIAISAEQLNALDRLSDRTSDMRDLGDPLWRSWCNGTTGAVLTWVEAFRATRDTAWLDLAIRDARAWDEPVDSANDPGTLCCGTGGWASASLALADASGDDGWRDRALTLAVQAFERLDSPWQHGLLRGYPGLVCLALDLLTSRSPRGFPLVAA